jgi:anti-anti-sigma factor
MEIDAGAPPTPFAATITFGDGVLHLSGELDAACAVALAASLDQAVSVSVHVVLELSGVTFIDSTALRTLLDTWRRIAPLGGTMTTRNPPPKIARLFDITGTNRIITLAAPPAPA